MTSDTIHTTLLELGYSSDAFGAVRTAKVAHAVYSKPGGTIVVSWYSGRGIYELRASDAEAASRLCGEFVRRGLQCHSSGHRIDVYGQEHIDAEVMKMLGQG